MTYSELLVVETRANIEARLRTAAKAKGASPDTWKDRSIPAVLVYALSVILLALYNLLNFFAGGANFSESSEASLAKQWAYSQFGLTQEAATAAVFPVTFTCADGSGPYTLTTAFKIQTVWGQEYFLTQELVVTSEEPVTGYIQAVVAGTAGNIDPDEIVNIVTPESGLTADVGDIYTSGTDQETIPALYARCQLQWAGIGGASTEFVQNQAIKMDPLLTKVRTRVDDTTAGVMTIYLGQVAGPANDDQVAAFQTLIDGLQVFQAVAVTVVHAAPEQLEISGTVYYFPGRGDEAEEAVSDAIALWQTTLGYGDTIRASDFWRKTFGADANGVVIEGLFGSTAIDYVDFTPDSGYTIDQWSLTVLLNSLVFTETV